MEQIIELSKREGMKAIRLDVVADNLPAIRMYEKAGFQYIATVDMGYHMFGLMHLLYINCFYKSRVDITAKKRNG